MRRADDDLRDVRPEYPPENVDGDMPIINVARLYPPPGWKKVFIEADPEIECASRNVYKRRIEGEIVIPHNVDIFRAFWLTPLKDVKVVILGQDPYHQVDRNGYTTAMGLSFSVRDGDDIPKSLLGIFKELSRSVDDYTPPNSGNLECWAKQGVLLLNSCLTVAEGQPDSHSKYKIWMPFIKIVLEHIHRVNRDTIYMLWGAKAREFKKYLPDKAVILEASHPSPLGADSGVNRFNGCDHFNKCNDLLKKFNLTPIKW